MKKIRGKLIDYWKRKIYSAEIIISEGKIISITEINDEEPEEKGIIMPGFIDSHIHIESSMLIPSEFARLAVIHGTIGSISDPHEIANVCGIEGVRYMIENGNKVPFKFHFGAPSCVPATSYETAGDVLDAEAVERLLESDDIFYLSEMMNFPGVLNRNPEVMKKISSAKKINKPVDGHAPGLRGEKAKQYIEAGISTDHECFTAEEALDKLNAGMKIIIREGSAAKNFDALIGLLDQHYENIMFCSDDKHPDSLMQGHINVLCRRAAANGIDIFKIIQAATINPIIHYRMKCGMLREGDPADFIIVDSLENFNVIRTYIDGEIVSENESTLIPSVPAEIINKFHCSRKSPDDFAIPVKNDDDSFPVIEALDGQLITNRIDVKLKSKNGFYQTDIQNDILKIAVVNRYNESPVAVGFIKNFKLNDGAIGSSVAHDSHNIVAVGTDDDSICRAVNLIIDVNGGVSCIHGKQEMLLALPVGGLMSAADGFTVGESYTAIDLMAKQAGSTLSAPFMTLSFMALLVIPHLKLSDKGIFNGDTFQFVNF